MSTTGSGNTTSEEAAYWRFRMVDSADAVSSEERAKFGDWVAKPENEQAFREVNFVATLLGDMPAAVRERWEQENRDARERRHSRRQVLRWSAAAASLIGVLVAGGVYVQSTHLFGESYVTAAGQTRTVTFKEGSVAHLNTRSELRWIGDEDDRRIEMVEGEVLFDVVHDDARPFRILLNNSEIRVLGTRFNVYRKPNGDTIVTVLEGTVEVRGFGNGGSAEWVRRIEANQQIEYRAIGLMREPHGVEAQNAVRWRSGLYKFTDVAISDVVDELTRYTDSRIVIRDPRIAEHRISGGLQTRDVREALKHLEEVAPLEVKESRGTFTIDFRDDASGRKD